MPSGFTFDPPPPPLPSRRSRVMPNRALVIVAMLSLADTARDSGAPPARVAEQLALGLGYGAPPGMARRLLTQWKARRHLPKV